MSLVISLGGMENPLRTTDFSNTQFSSMFSGGGHWGTCSALFSSSTVGDQTSLNQKLRMFSRLFLIASANSRYNRLYGWGTWYAVFGLFFNVMSMHDLELDLRYCPPDLSLTNSLHGGLERVLEDTPFDSVEAIRNDRGSLVGFQTNLAPTPIPLSSGTIANATSMLMQDTSVTTGQWVIPQVALYGLIQRQCQQQKKNYHDQDKRFMSCSMTYANSIDILKQTGFIEMGAKTGLPLPANVTKDTLHKLYSCQKNSIRTAYGDYVARWVGGNDIDRFSVPGETLSAKNIIQAETTLNYSYSCTNKTNLGASSDNYYVEAPDGNYIEAPDNYIEITNTSLFVHNGGVPLTFNTMDTYWRKDHISTISLLSKIMWPVPTLPLTTAVSFPAKAREVRSNPRTLAELVDDAFDTQSVYASRNGGYWKIVNWVNYLSLYIEFLLVVWILVKGILRSSPTARIWLEKSMDQTEKMVRKDSGLSKKLSHKLNAKNIGKNDKKTPIHYLGLPTRLKAAVILSVFMCVGIAWRIGGMWSHLLEGVTDMRSTYENTVKKPWDTLKPLLNVQNLTAMGKDYVQNNSAAYLTAVENAVAQYSGTVTVNGKNLNDLLAATKNTPFQLLTGSVGASNSGTTGLQKVLLTNLPTSTVDVQQWVTDYVSTNLQSAVKNSSTVNTTILNYFIPMSTRQSYLAAKSVIGPCTLHIVNGAEDLLVQTTYGFGARVLQEVINDPTSTLLFEMSTTDRNTLLTKAVTQATADSFEQCPASLDTSMTDFAQCLANSTIETLLGVDPSDSDADFDYVQLLTIEDVTGGACDNSTQRTLLGTPYTTIGAWPCGSIASTQAELISSLAVSFHAVYNSVDLQKAKQICQNMETRFQNVVLQYGVDYLGDWEQLLTAQLEIVINSESTKKLLSRIPGIDTEQFRNFLLTTDAKDGSVRLGPMIQYVRDLVLEQDYTEKAKNLASANSVHVDTSALDVALRKNAARIDEDLKQLHRIVELTFNALVSGCRAGIGITVVALLGLLFMMSLFTMNVYTLGYFQHETIVKLFHPTKGYVPALKKIVNRTVEETDGIDTDIDSFQLVDLFALMGREPTRKETALLNGLNNARQRLNHDVDGDGILDEEEIRIGKQGVTGANKLIQIHIAESLQYRTVLSSPSFLATYLYMQMFGFLIYFALLFVILVLPFQELFWITIGKYYTVWGPILTIIVIKSIVQKLLVKRLEMDKGQ